MLARGTRTLQAWWKGVTVLNVRHDRWAWVRACSRSRARTSTSVSCWRGAAGAIQGGSRERCVRRRSRPRSWSWARAGAGLKRCRRGGRGRRARAMVVQVAPGQAHTVMAEGGCGGRHAQRRLPGLVGGPFRRHDEGRQGSSTIGRWPRFPRQGIAGPGVRSSSDGGPYSTAPGRGSIHQSTLWSAHLPAPSFTSETALALRELDPHAAGSRGAHMEWGGGAHGGDGILLLEGGRPGHRRCCSHTALGWPSIPYRCRAASAAWAAPERCIASRPTRGRALR